MRVKHAQDFWSGILFLAIGLLGVLFSRDYAMGTAARMGPGYFPTLLSGILAALGVIIALGAMMSKATPKVSHTGIAYMIAPGSSSWGSNTDPGAEKATADNEWGNDPPHIMLIVTDPSALAGIQY